MAAQLDMNPQAFSLKMRFVTPDGTPMARRRFRVRWGDALHPPPGQPPWQTDSHGAMSAELPANAARLPGEVQFLEPSAEGERIVWRVPLQLAEEPLPVVHPWNAPAPASPQPGASQEERLWYERAVTAYRENALRLIRERWAMFARAWDELAAIEPTLAPTPEESMSDAELWEKLTELCSIMGHIVNAYEAAFRLWNLADLPLRHPPALGSLAHDKEGLRRAIDRFAFRHGLPVPLARTVFPALAPLWLDKIKDAHDRRGPLGPANSLPEQSS